MLWVVAPYFNFKNDPRREENLYRFVDALPKQAKLCLVELVLPGTDPTAIKANIHEVVVTDKAEMWCKEALINVGIKALPKDCDKVCWMDADVQIVGDWWDKVDALLDEHPVVQPFSRYVLLGEGEKPGDKEYKQSDLSKSFAYQANKRANSGYRREPINFYHYHPGFAWAARLDFLKKIGLLFPFCILGHGDIVMCAAFSKHLPTIRLMWIRKNHYYNLFTREWNGALRLAAYKWQINVHEIMGDEKVGVLDGVLYHWYHGSLNSRQYEERSKLLFDYNPERDTFINDKGMIEWTKIADKELRERVSKYFSERAKTS
jgi:hypothetical protein